MKEEEMEKLIEEMSVRREKLVGTLIFDHYFYEDIDEYLNSYEEAALSGISYCLDNLI